MIDAPEAEVEAMRWHAMGSDAHIVIVGGPRDGLELARARIVELEHRWSRFIATSEVCALRRRAGEWVAVSDDTVRLVELSCEGWHLSGGAFDALVLDDVERAGYDRTFDEVRDGARSTPVDGPTLLRPYPTAIEIDAGRIRVPGHCGFDPGGIGKGLAADFVVDELLRAGAEGACVNLGGDLRAAGRAPAGGDWTIEIEDPRSTGSLLDIAIRDGAVATSSTQRRRWLKDGSEQHHLIDPATGEPSTTDLIAATIVAGAGWSAEVLAKAALLRGSHRWRDILPPGVEGLAVDDHGHIHTTPGLARFTLTRTTP